MQALKQNDGSATKPMPKASPHAASLMPAQPQPVGSLLYKKAPVSTRHNSQSTFQTFNFAAK